ncbi:tetratricopeptide repeat protein [Thiosocius teredinicola]|uniref:tetratricopeptide repeat protein n=1 Tax=Thiosocius teredinicola TaxID=1973002 RepID=UPI000990F2D9
MADANFILAANEFNFDALVLENSRKGLVLVDFWAPWAGPSLRQQQVLKKLADEYRGRFLLVTVNTDEEKGIAGRFAVKSLPSVKLFRNGQVVEAMHGMQAEADYKAMVDRHLASAGDEVRVAAAKAWNAGEHDKAVGILAEGVAEEPENLAIPAMLAKLLVRLSRFDEAREVLAKLPPQAREIAELTTLRAYVELITLAQRIDDEQALFDRLDAQPVDLQAHLEAAALHVQHDRFEAALQSLIVVLRHDREFEDGVARRGVLAIFDMLGSDHALVKKYRGELARLIH